MVAGMSMTQPELERAVAEGAAGSGYMTDAVVHRGAPGVWDIYLRCRQCGPFRFLLIEQMYELNVHEQVKKEVERHGRRH
jgi:hypothetical protein